MWIRRRRRSSGTDRVAGTDIGNIHYRLCDPLVRSTVGLLAGWSCFHSSGRTWYQDLINITIKFSTYELPLWRIVYDVMKSISIGCKCRKLLMFDILFLLIWYHYFAGPILPRLFAESPDWLSPTATLWWVIWMLENWVLYLTRAHAMRRSLFLLCDVLLLMPHWVQDIKT